MHRPAFIKYKGDKRENEFEELAIEFKVKLAAALSDSGKIVFPFPVVILCSLLF
jgi:hypothetical protein